MSSSPQPRHGYPEAFAGQSAVSHVSIAFECATTGRVLVMEAAGGGFRGITWERWQRENEIIRIFRIDVPTQQWQEGLGEFCDTLGSPYDTPRLFREAARHLTQGWTQQFTWANSQTNAKGVLCADAVAAFLHRIGFTQFEYPLRWTPGALLEYAKREQAFVPMTSRISSEELVQLANLYQPGQSLWRVPIEHFTPWDCNWPYGPPSDAQRPPRGTVRIATAKTDVLLKRNAKRWEKASRLR